MSKKVRTFDCKKCDKKEECLVEDIIIALKCEGGSEAVRMLAAPRCFQNTTGKSPSC